MTQDSQDLVLAKTAIAKFDAGSVSLGDLWSALSAPKTADVSRTQAPPPVLALTDAQKAALDRLPEVYGRVSPTENRRLTEQEAADIVEERSVIDTILSVIEKRKSGSIREIIANHLDHVLLSEVSAEELDEIPVDKAGHLQRKQEVSIESTGMKFQKTVSDPKPRLSIDAVEKAHAEGLIDRATYLKITKKPDNPRVLHEDGLVKAMKADPSLLLLLSTLTEKNDPTTTIKVVKDNR